MRHDPGLAGVVDRRAMQRTAPRRLLSALPVLACMLTLLCAAGCGDACLSLASQICSCLPDDGTRAACNRRAQDTEASYPIRPEDKAYCQQRLDSNACDCNHLNTPAGKQACGLSYSPPR